MQDPMRRQDTKKMMNEQKDSADVYQSKVTKYEQLEVTNEQGRTRIAVALRNLEKKVEQRVAEESADPRSAIKDLTKDIYEVIDIVKKYVAEVTNDIYQNREQLTEKVSSIRWKSQRRTVVTKKTIGELWRVVERGNGRGKLIIMRRNGKITTLRKLYEIDDEDNSEDAEIIHIKLTVEDTPRSCAIEWRSGDGDSDRTEIYIFEEDRQGEARMSELSTICRKYEQESERERRIRIGGKWAFTLVTGMTIGLWLEDKVKQLGNTGWEVELISTTVLGVAVMVHWEISKKIDTSVEFGIGQGINRSKKRKWIRRTLVTTALAAVAAVLVSTFGPW